MIKQLLLYGLILMSWISFAQESNFEEGNALYEAGEYESAIEKYGTAISEGYHSAELYYNLGNAHYRLENLGKAIWAYESALKIEPNHKDAVFNLEFVNAQTVDQIDPQRHGFGHWIQGIAFTSNVNFWMYLSILFSLLFSIAASYFVLSKKGKKRNISLLTAGILGIALPLSIWIGYQHKNHLTSRDHGVVITKQVNVLLSPTEDGKISYKLSEGAKVELISEEKDWVQINLNGNQGWLQKKDVWEI